jgi:hypothetical protein
MSRSYNPQQPLDDCPHCKVAVKHTLFDGVNSYDCGKGLKKCPIEFTERVWFPTNTTDFDFASGHGVLFYYGFRVGDIHAVVDYGGDGRLPQRQTPRLIIHPKYMMGNLSGGGIVIDPMPDIDWSNVESLENKLKTLTTFS